jgi:hypothetical protein
MDRTNPNVYVKKLFDATEYKGRKNGKPPY